MSVIRGDARRLPLADGSVHLAITSPPYNARIKYDEYEDWLPWDEYWHGLIAPALRECYRVLVDGGRICVNLANVVRSNVPGIAIIQDGYRPDGAKRPLRYRARGGRKWCPAGSNGEPWALMIAPRMWGLLEDIGFLPREQLTWVKGDDPADTTNTSTAWGTFASARNPVLRAVAEPIFIASKVSHAREPGLSDLTADEFKAWTRNTWNIPTGTARYGEDWHPATFPIELPRRLIKLYSYVGDTVLDPFLGRGTTLRAALITGRKGIGVELSHAYCRRAAGWLSQGMLPLVSPSPRSPPATQLALGEER